MVNCQMSNVKEKGFIFLEIIIAIALIGIVFTALLGIGFSLLSTSSSLQKQGQADALAKEEIEAVRAFRDSKASTWSSTGLGSYSTGIVYHMSLGGSPTTWSIASGQETTGIFTRQVAFDRVSRDANGNIVLAGGVDDPDTRKVTATVAWGSKTYQIISYLTNWQK